MWNHELALVVRSYEDKICLQMVTEVYYMNNKTKIRFTNVKNLNSGTLNTCETVFTNARMST